MNILIRKDGEGFLAEVENTENIFAYGNTEEEAKTELLNVLDMMMEYHLEQVEIEQGIKESILKNNITYAV